MAGLVAPRSWTSLGSDCQSLPQGFRFRLPSISRPQLRHFAGRCCRARGTPATPAEHGLDLVGAHTGGRGEPHGPYFSRAIAVHALTFYICTCRVSWYVPH
jgi:hypothetical protein